MALLHLFACGSAVSGSADSRRTETILAGRADGRIPSPEVRRVPMFVSGSVRYSRSLAVVAVLTACANTTPVSDADMTRAAGALQPLKRELRAALTGALEEGGPERAIEVCQLRAPEIARVAATRGAVLGRTSHRLRNPENAPEPWMSDFLGEYLANPGDNEPRAVRLASGEIGYVEPIRMKGICMRCHGDSIEPGVKDRLRALYPEDQATGFTRGELRGIFWVKLPADAP